MNNEQFNLVENINFFHRLRLIINSTLSLA